MAGLKLGVSEVVSPVINTPCARCDNPLPSAVRCVTSTVLPGSMGRYCAVIGCPSAKYEGAGAVPTWWNVGSRLTGATARCVLGSVPLIVTPSAEPVCCCITGCAPDDRSRTLALVAGITPPRP